MAKENLCAGSTVAVMCCCCFFFYFTSHSLCEMAIHIAIYVQERIFSGRSACFSVLYIYNWVDRKERVYIRLWLWYTSHSDFMGNTSSSFVFHKGIPEFKFNYLQSLCFTLIPKTDKRHRHPRHHTCDGIGYGWAFRID